LLNSRNDFSYVLFYVILISNTLSHALQFSLPNSEHTTTPSNLVSKSKLPVSNYLACKTSHTIIMLCLGAEIFGRRPVSKLRVVTLSELRPGILHSSHPLLDRHYTRATLRSIMTIMLHIFASTFVDSAALRCVFICAPSLND
jgi:hypothetical protein